MLSWQFPRQETPLDTDTDADTGRQWDVKSALKCQCEVGIIKPNTSARIKDSTHTRTLRVKFGAFEAQAAGCVCVCVCRISG